MRRSAKVSKYDAANMLIDGMKKNAGTMAGAWAALLVSESEVNQ